MLLFFLLWLLGCGGGGGVGGTETGKTHHQASVAVVNGWPSVDEEAYAKLLSDNGLTLTEIEGFPWVDRRSLCDDEHPTGCSDPYREKRQKLLRAMSAHKVVVYINPVNFNSAFARRQSVANFADYVAGIVKDCSDVGIENCWMGTGSEPWATPDQHDALAKARVVRAQWPGVLVMPDKGENHPTGQPYFQDIAHDLVEVHPCSLPDAVEAAEFGPPVFTVTDCGPVLNPGPEMSKALAAFGHPLIIYDHLAVQPDVEGNRAIGSIR
jgi:hypothetical protein